MRNLVKALMAIIAPAPKATIPAPVVKATTITPSFSEELDLLRAYDNHHIDLLEKEIATLRKMNGTLKQEARTNARAAARAQARLEESETALDTMIRVAGDRLTRMKRAEELAADVCTLANNHAADVISLQDSLLWQERMTEEASNEASLWGELAQKYWVRAQVMEALFRSAKARSSSSFTLPAVATQITDQEALYLALRRVDEDCDLAVDLRDGLQVVAFGHPSRDCRDFGKARRGHRHGHVPMRPRQEYHYLNR